MKTTLTRGLFAAIALVTLTGRSADAGIMEQIQAIPTDAQSVSFNPFNPAFGHLYYVGIVINATFQPITKAGYDNDGDAPLNLYGVADVYLNAGLNKHNTDEFPMHASYYIGDQVVNPGDSGTLTTPALDVSSSNILTAIQWTTIGGTDTSHPKLSLAFDAIEALQADAYNSQPPEEFVGGDYSGTVKIYYFYNVPGATISDLPFLIPEPSTMISAGIAVVTGLGFARRLRRRSIA